MALIQYKRALLLHYKKVVAFKQEGDCIFIIKVEAALMPEADVTFIQKIEAFFIQIQEVDVAFIQKVEAAFRKEVNLAFI